MRVIKSSLSRNTVGNKEISQLLKSCVLCRDRAAAVPGELQPWGRSHVGGVHKGLYRMAVLEQGAEAGGVLETKHF